jgi:DNA-binding response OmpR family regulator
VRNGTAILIVEDETLIALDIETILRSSGYGVVGPVPSLGQAMREARESQLDAAILDIRLDQKDTVPVADILTERQVPFMFLSGHGIDAVPERFRERVVLRKPFAARHLLGQVAKLIR